MRTVWLHGNIGMELNLVIGKINHMSQNFIPPTFNTCIKTLGIYTFWSVFEYHVFEWNMCLHKFLASADLAYKGFTANYISEARWTETAINLCIECSLNLLCNTLWWYVNGDSTLYPQTSLLSHKLPIIRLCLYY